MSVISVHFFRTHRTASNVTLFDIVVLHITYKKHYTIRLGTSTYVERSRNMHSKIYHGVVHLLVIVRVVVCYRATRNILSICYSIDAVHGIHRHFMRLFDKLINSIRLRRLRMSFTAF